jgi:hypothetical protein
MVLSVMQVHIGVAAVRWIDLSEGDVRI